MKKKYRKQIKGLGKRLEAVAKKYHDAKLSDAQYAAADQLLAGVGAIIEGLDSVISGAPTNEGDHDGLDSVISGASTNEGGHDGPELEPESAEEGDGAHQKLVDAFDMAHNSVMNSAVPFGVLLMGAIAVAMFAVFATIATV